MKLLKFALLCLALAIFIIACDQTPTNNNTATNTTKNSTVNAANDAAQNSSAAANMPVNIPEDIAQDGTVSGRKIYMEVCANCHKEDGTGGKVTIEGKTINADNLTTAKMAKMSDAKYVDYIKNGIPDEGMPAFKDKLNDEQIDSVIKFIRTEFQGK